ncbi:hypothetical protein EAG_04008 [Camponotus floridanus]|uniref:Uncharacterized protein n=1 Tax=Camponotus floridanus TaxID=104421 RepID=E1ZV40_CAMFO|nr:uncharacterized protein LOC105257343 [Camponotus floridanus]EFN74949.1 hypothetical protein EAG_04008 [Camponotus floridanus]
MPRLESQNIVYILLILSTITLVRCALLEMSQMLWNKTVSGGLTKIGKLDPLRVPVIKIDQSEGEISYRVILRNLEIVGLNESILESIYVARSELNSNLSDFEAGYVSYSNIRDVDSVRYSFHTMMREPNVPKENFEDIVSSVNRADIRPSSRYQEARFEKLQQDQDGSRTFEQNQQYNRRTPFRSDVRFDDFHRDSLKASSNLQTNPENFKDFKRPTYVQPIYAQKARDIQGYQGSSRSSEEIIDCGDSKDSQFRGNQKGSQKYEPRQDADDRYERRIEDVEVSASKTVETRLKSQGDARPPTLYNREQSLRSNLLSNVKLSRHGVIERTDYIDIVYADDKANGSIKHFGNLGINPVESRQVYDIEDIMKGIRENTRFIIHNFTEGEALRKRNDLVKAAMEANNLRNLTRYAKGYQEQQGYFEEGMQLIYHYGEMDVRNDSASQNISDNRRTKRARSKEADEDDVMRVILRIRVPLLRVKSQYTLTGKVGKEMLRGNGLLTGNFTDVVGDFTLELKKLNEELIIIRAARAKLSAKDKKINLQGMNEAGPVQVILNYGLTAAEAIAAMLADDFATKGLSEKTADALIYRMYENLPVN